LRETQGLNAQTRCRTQLTAARAGTTKTYTVPAQLPSAATAGARVLVGTVGFQALGLVATDYTIPDRFIPWTEALSRSPERTGSCTIPSQRRCPRAARGLLATAERGDELAGRSASATALPITVVEFYNASLDHYFISPLAPDIDALGHRPLPPAGRAPAARSPHGHRGCRRVPGESRCAASHPAAEGDSHFFSASPVECADVERQIATDPNYAGFVYETPAAFTSACRTR